MHARREHEADEEKPPDRADHVSSLPAAVANGATRRSLVDAALDELLPHLSLLRHAQEEPGERDDRDERALEHHQRPGEALVGVRREPEVVVSGVVDVVERRAAPDEDVADHGRDEADADDVRELRPGAEPLRGGERLEDREPEHDPGAEERDVLEGVQRARLDRSLVKGREVPEDEVRRPDREGDERVREDAQAHDAG